MRYVLDAVGDGRSRLTTARRCTSIAAGAMPLYSSSMRRPGPISGGISARYDGMLALAAASICSDVFMFEERGMLRATAVVIVWDVPFQSSNVVRDATCWGDGG